MTGYTYEQSPGVPERYETPGDLLELLAIIGRHESRHLVVPRIYRLPSPSVGVDWSTTVPSGVTWLPLSIIGLLTTSATVATRGPMLIYSDGLTSAVRFPGAATIPASSSFRYCYLRGYGDHQATNGAATVAPLPTIAIPGGWTVQSSTTNIDAADQWSTLSLYVLEIRNRTRGERQALLEQLAQGESTDLYPGLLIGV